MLILLLVLPGVWSIGTTPGPAFNHYNPLPFKAVQFVKPVPTKKGPILFPNDAPPPPPTPLIVTSRPLAESIARSELNPNNSVTAQSQVTQVSYNPYNLNNPIHVPNSPIRVHYPPHVPNPVKPNFLARVKTYSPYSYIAATNSPINGYRSTVAPYRNNLDENDDDFYTEYEKRLMETIHRRNIRPTEKTLWNQPIYRRNISQDEQRSEKLNVLHGSLYSREKNEFNQRLNNSRDSYEDVYYRRSNRDRNVHRKSNRRTHRKKHFRRRRYKPSRRQYHRSHTNNKWDKVTEISIDEDVIKERSLRPLYALRGRNEPKPIPVKTNNYEYQPNPPSHQSPNHYEDEEDKHTDKYNQKGENYAFSYTVKDRKTGDDFSHSQQHTGSATNGEYRVRLPDGRMQIVSYTADENGYKADVRYDDEHHENSIDTDYNNHNNHYNKDQEKQYKTKENYYDDTDTEFPANKDYVDQQFKSISPQFYFETNEKGGRPHKHNFDDYSLNDVDKSPISEDNDDYLDNYKNKNSASSDKLESGSHNDRNYHKNNDEEIEDYSLENTGYHPHKSKFASLTQSATPVQTVTPSYESLKHLFVTNTLKRLENKAYNILSTIKPHFETTTENVVLITSKRPNFYTNIKSFSSASPTPLPIVVSTPRPSFTTPSSYLVSTIANLRNQINLQSNPVLSKSYIERINKYLSYKK